MMDDEERNLQVGDTEQAPQSGSESNQTAAVPAAVEQSGDETETSAEITTAAAKPARTYTEQDIQAIQSTKDIEIRQRDEILNRLAMEQHIQQLRSQEETARNKDKQLVETGAITEDDAHIRARAREETSQMGQTLTAQRQQAEVLGRLQAGYDLGIKYGIDPQTLINDTSIKTYPQMLEKASDLGHQILKEKLRTATAHPETFDQGPKGGGVEAG